MSDRRLCTTSRVALRSLTLPARRPQVRVPFATPDPLDLPLHAADGNHQSAVGAFLTAAFLYARLTGESPAALAALAAFPYPNVGEADRTFLAGAAARAAEPGATP